MCWPMELVSNSLEPAAKSPSRRLSCKNGLKGLRSAAGNVSYMEISGKYHGNIWRNLQICHVPFLQVTVLANSDTCDFSDTCEPVIACYSWENIVAKNGTRCKGTNQCLSCISVCIFLIEIKSNSPISTTISRCICNQKLHQALVIFRSIYSRNSQRVSMWNIPHFAYDILRCNALYLLI